MKFKVTLKIKTVTVEADSEDTAIENAWSLISDNVSEMVKATATEVK